MSLKVAIRHFGSSRWKWLCRKTLKVGALSPTCRLLLPCEDEAVENTVGCLISWLYPPAVRLLAKRGAMRGAGRAQAGEGGGLRGSLMVGFGWWDCAKCLSLVKYLRLDITSDIKKGERHVWRRW